MNKQEFTEYVKDFCNNNNINFITNDKDVIQTIASPSDCAGFFEATENNRTLGIAGLLEDSLYLEILAHEFCHSLQFIKNTESWRNNKLTKQEEIYYSDKLGLSCFGFEAGDIVALWIDNKIELDYDTIKNLVERTSKVEIECEIMTTEIISSLNLPINIEEYAQKANAYCITYFYALKNRKWTAKGKTPYRTPEFYSTLPVKIDYEFCKELRNDVERLLIELCS